MSNAPISSSQPIMSDKSVSTKTPDGQYQELLEPPTLRRHHSPLKCPSSRRQLFPPEDTSIITSSPKAIGFCMLRHGGGIVTHGNTISKTDSYLKDLDEAGEAFINAFMGGILPPIDDESRKHNERIRNYYALSLKYARKIMREYDQKAKGASEWYQFNGVIKSPRSSHKVISSIEP